MRPALYETLARTTAHLDRTLARVESVVADVRRNPRRYLSVRVF